jgi:histidine phosphotransferase ChpT
MAWLKGLVVEDDADVGLLAEMLCARLCHDLAGAVGAVTAGAELLAEEGPASPMAAEALDLMATSAASMAARLRFLRLALGPANQGAATQARNLALAFFSKGQPQGEWSLDWPADRAVDATPDQIKLLLNLLCLAQDCLPRGGTIRVQPDEGLVVLALAANAVMGEAAHGLSAAALSGLGPRAMQGAYAALLARRLGAVVTLLQTDDGVSFRVQPAA